MDDFHNRSNLDYQRDPLDSKNLMGVHWNDALRKEEPPPLNFDADNEYQNNGNEFSSLIFIAYLFLGFFCLMGLVWVYRLFYGFING